MLTRRGALGLAAGAAVAVPFLARAQESRPLTDAAGRRVTVPGRVTRVLASGPPGSVFLYTLAPDTMIGWIRPPTPEEKPYLKAPYADLPVYARMTGRGDSIDIAAVQAHRADIILDIGAVDPGYVALANRIQAQVGVPYVLLDGTLDKTAESYRILGNLLGRTARAEELAKATAALIADVRGKIAAVPQDRRPRVLYARGPKGTVRANPINVDVLDVLGAVNVAPPRAVREPLTMEEIRRADPTAILAIDEAFFESVMTDPAWADIAAVKARRVFHAPTLPFNWLDDPPGVNRLIGLRWLAERLYPELRFGDLRAAIRDFYRVFYHQMPTVPQVEALMKQAAPHA
jgi:iron complex transport system substrate-binding protein